MCWKMLHFYLGPVAIGYICTFLFLCYINSDAIYSPCRFIFDNKSVKNLKNDQQINETRSY